MSENKNRNLVPKDGIFNDLATRIKLIIRLMADSRVNPLLKLLPIGSLLYFVIPDLVVGPIDDVAIIWLGTFLFVELCPPAIVQEHLDTLKQTLPGPAPEASGEGEGEGEVIDGEFWEKKD